MSSEHSWILAIRDAMWNEVVAHAAAPISERQRRLLVEASKCLSRAGGDQHAKVYLDKFDVDDPVAVMMQAFAGTAGKMVRPEIVAILPGTIHPPPRLPSQLEVQDLGDKLWKFCPDLAVTTVKMIDCKMHVDLGHEIWELVHLKNEHWSTWRHYSTSRMATEYACVLSVFPDDSGSESMLWPAEVEDR